jgi:hypothetical protein
MQGNKTKPGAADFVTQQAGIAIPYEHRRNYNHLIVLLFPLLGMTNGVGLTLL